jgi:magnesium transporter
VGPELAQGRLRGLSTAKRHRFVLHLPLHVAARYLACLRDINREVDALEDRLQRSLQNRELQELLKFQKSLVYFTTALKSNELMIERLQKTLFFQAYPEDQDLLDDVLTENRQAIEMTNIASNILSQMMDAFASIISNNLNSVMKLLASATIMLTVPTLIASFYGMNLDLPGETAPQAFAVVVGVSLALVVLTGFVFWKRDWL